MDLLLIIVNGDFETNKLRNQEILLKKKKTKTQVVIKKSAFTQRHDKPIKLHCN